MKATVYDQAAAKGQSLLRSLHDVVLTDVFCVSTDLAAKSYTNLNIVSGGTPKNSNSSQQAPATTSVTASNANNPFQSNMWSTILQVGSNSVGVEKLADDSKTEFVAQIFGDVGELIDGKLINYFTP